MKLELVVHGKPIPWARPAQGRFGRYDSQKHVKDALGLIFRGAIGKHLSPTGIFRLTLKFYLPRPNKKKSIGEGEVHHIRPDLDNLTKLVLDAGNGILWQDDSMIVSIHAEKFYSSTPRTYILVEWQYGSKSNEGLRSQAHECEGHKCQGQE